MLRLSMNTRLFAALFTAIFFTGALPMLLIEPSGSASAGLAAGFVLPLTNACQVVILLAIGLIAAWVAQEAILVLPLCTLLMVVIGALMEVDDRALHAVRAF